MFGAPPTPPALVPQQTFVAPQLGAPSGEAGYENGAGDDALPPVSGRESTTFTMAFCGLRTRYCVVCCVIITKLTVCECDISIYPICQKTKLPTHSHRQDPLKLRWGNFEGDDADVGERRERVCLIRVNVYRSSYLYPQSTVPTQRGRVLTEGSGAASL
jgi:hypothetical protein